MRFINIPNSNLVSSQIILGCMRISQMSIDEVEELVKAALDKNINFFDHADIYGGGKSEALFGEVLKRNPHIRSKMIIQTKCGIRQGYYDNSAEHILTSVEASLRRLNTNYIDVLLLHRPDALIDYNEVSNAFNTLYQSKKVRYFGVSNMNSTQVELLQKHLKQKLIFNQLQFSIVHSLIVDEGFNVNMKNNYAINRGGSIIEYSQLNDITIQAWSVLQASWEEGSFLNHPNYLKLNEKLNELAVNYQVEPSTIAISWILRHPANIQAIVGTTSIKHLSDLSLASEVNLTRKEWYELYSSVDKKLP